MSYAGLPIRQAYVNGMIELDAPADREFGTRPKPDSAEEIDA
jgi:hypothetical protein